MSLDMNSNFKFVTFLAALLSFFSSFLVASSLPHTPANAPKSLSISLHSVSAELNSTGVHSAITHQQHINRGVRRLAMMAGWPMPTHDELWSELYTRISSLPEGAQLLSQDTNSSVSSPTGESASVPLDIESNDVGYFCEMKLGTPPRPFKMLVDSGSGDLWVGAEGCGGDNNGGCGRHNFLGPNSSTTLKITNETWLLFYGSGAVSGILAYDDCSIGDMVVHEHKFGLARNESSTFTPDDVPFDGILGTAQSNVSRQHTKTFVEALRDAGEISEATVSYRIPRLADQSTGQNEGRMTIGGMDDSQYDPDTLVALKNVNTNGFWEVPMDSMVVNGNNMTWTDRTVIMDTGTTLLIVPKEDAEAIHRSIPGATLDSSGAYKVPCTTNASVSMTFSGRAFPIDCRDIAWSPVDTANPEGDCWSGIHGGDFGFGPTHWLAGDTILKNLYFSTNIERNEISLASLV